MMIALANQLMKCEWVLPVLADVNINDAKRLMVPSPHLAPDKSQAISFKAIKACYPFTIKGGSFSLLCYQPEAVPTSLKTLTSKTALGNQYLPLI